MSANRRLNSTLPGCTGREKIRNVTRGAASRTSQSFSEKVKLFVHLNTINYILKHVIMGKVSISYSENTI